jgi:hypothetical protein
MPRMRFPVPALIALLFITRCGGDLQQDELDCQQAAEQLSKCCPGFQPLSLNCTYTQGSDDCGGSRTPDFTIPESQCIVGESCDTLLATRVCMRVTNGFAGGSLCP